MFFWNDCFCDFRLLANGPWELVSVHGTNLITDEVIIVINIIFLDKTEQGEKHRKPFFGISKKIFKHNDTKVSVKIVNEAFI